MSEDYLPGDRLEGYATRMAGHTLRSLVPEGKSPATFVDALSAKYKKARIYLLFRSCSIQFLASQRLW